GDVGGARLHGGERCHQKCSFALLAARILPVECSDRLARLGILLLPVEFSSAQVSDIVGEVGIMRYRVESASHLFGVRLRRVMQTPRVEISLYCGLFRTMIQGRQGIKSI